MFKVNQRVVCVNDDWEGKHSHSSFPVRNEIVTINGIEYSKGKPYLVLKEHDTDGVERCRWNAKKFRPLQDTFATITEQKAYIQHLEEENKELRESKELEPLINK